MARGGEKLVAGGVAFLSGAAFLKTGLDLGLNLTGYHAAPNHNVLDFALNPIFPNNIPASVAEFVFAGLPALAVSAVAVGVADSTENNS